MQVAWLVISRVQKFIQVSEEGQGDASSRRGVAPRRPRRRMRPSLTLFAKKKNKSAVVRLVSQAGTGFFYTLRKAIKANTEKCARRHTPCCAQTTCRCARTRTRARTRVMARPHCQRRAPGSSSSRLQLIKLDPRVNARVLFKEERIKKK